MQNSKLSAMRCYVRPSAPDHLDSRVPRKFGVCNGALIEQLLFVVVQGEGVASWHKLKLFGIKGKGRDVRSDPRFVGTERTCEASARPIEGQFPIGHIGGAIIHVHRRSVF